MCPPDTSAVGACVSALSSVCSRGSGCPSQLGLGTVAWRVLDHGRTFAPCCWAGICPAEQSSGESQAQPQAVPFPAAVEGLHSPSLQHGGCPPSQLLWIHACSLGCKHQAESDNRAVPICSPATPCAPGKAWLRFSCGCRVPTSLPTSPERQCPAACQGVPCPGPPVPTPCPETP